MIIKEAIQADFREALRLGKEVEVLVRGIKREGFMIGKRFFYVDITGSWEVLNFGLYKIK